MQVKISERDHRIQGIGSRPIDRASHSQIKGHGAFAEILKSAQTAGPVTFSKHAAERLQAWGKPLDPDKLSQLEGAVDLASSKGARSTLVLMKGIAFVVAPQSRTVVTVIPDERMKENVFTSIDSAVLVDR
ncbi:MAG TPA: hypothetical protein GXX23_10430 [Firmicutes bacterium]|nr:hypothetical protein [Candidatus Fermentithermobacillaceae bacterium]